MKCMEGKDHGDIAPLISEGLAEGLRLAAEAHEAIRSRHQDRMAVTLAVALLLWIFFTFVLIFQFTDWGGPAAMMASFIILTAAFIGSFAVTAYMNREKGSFIFTMLITAALTSLLLFIVSARAIAVADRREREQTLVRWNERMEASQQAMEEIAAGSSWHI